MNELVSIIVPIYHVEKYIRQCLDSILYQTYQKLEIILVDDGSPDNCGMICDEYAAIDSRIRVIHQENRGLSAARNAGLDCATGDYIAFVDSDDWIDVRMIEKLLLVLEETSADLAICNFQMFYDESYTGERKEQFSPVKDEKLTADEAISKLLEAKSWYYVTAWNKLYKKYLFRELRFPEGYIHEDEAIIHYILGQCKCIVTVSELLYYYRQTNGSIMGSGFSPRRTDYLTALADRIRYAHHKKWCDLCDFTTIKFVYLFWDWYDKFPNTNENRKYKIRMDKSLKIALPFVLKNKSILVRHKLYMILICIHPKAYRAVNVCVRRIKSIL